MHHGCQGRRVARRLGVGRLKGQRGVKAVSKVCHKSSSDLLADRSRDTAGESPRPMYIFYDTVPQPGFLFVVGVCWSG